MVYIQSMHSHITILSALIMIDMYTSNNINYYYQTTLNLEKITVHNFSKENDIIKKLIINKKVINLME